MAKKDVKKRRRRRGRRRGRGGTVLLTALCVLLAAAGILAAVTVFFKIGGVEVRGETRYEYAELAAASEIQVGKNMFFFNKFASIDKMFDQFPYLKEITIRRRLPDTVEITVSDCAPAMVLESEGRRWLADEGGKLLEELTGEPSAGLCVVTGAPLTEPKVGKQATFSQPEKEKPLFLLLNTLRDDGIISNIGAIDFTQGYHISFTYLDRFTVRIGTTEDLSQKLRYLRAIVEDKLTPNQRGVIDVSDVQTARFIPE